MSHGLNSTTASFLGDTTSSNSNYNWYPSDHKAVMATILLNNEIDDRNKTRNILPILEHSLEIIEPDI